MMDTGKQYGFGGTRLVANAEFLVQSMSGSEQFADYESRVNYLLPGRSDTLTCVYNVSRFSGDFIVDIMRAHPQLMIGGILRDNPFYAPPDRFSGDLAKRVSG